jgi:membrane carboxypeptidase/penicillin-binding protein
MRRVWKAIGIVAVALVAFALGVSAWLYFYIADLPPVSELATFNPAAESEAQVRSCDGSKWLIHVVPTQKLGSYTIAAVTAAEGQPDPRSPYVAIFSPAKKSVVGYEVQLVRTLACTKQRHLSRELEELRIANDINRKFKQPELLTIYLNRVISVLGPTVSKRLRGNTLLSLLHR